MQIEIKVKIKDTEKVIATIKELGSKFWKTTKEKDTYYFSRHGVFKFKESENGECLLVHDYRPKESVTTALRTELPLDAVFSEKLLFILKDAVGIQLVLERERQQYLYHGVLLAIDSITDHEIFLELTSDEILQEKAAEEKEKLLELLAKFGFAEKDLETKSYVDMYLN